MAEAVGSSRQMSSVDARRVEILFEGMAEAFCLTVLVCTFVGFVVVVLGVAFDLNMFVIFVVACSILRSLGLCTLVASLYSIYLTSFILLSDQKRL